MHPDTRKLNIAERDLAVAQATIRRQAAEIDRLRSLTSTMTTASTDVTVSA